MVGEANAGAVGFALAVAEYQTPAGNERVAGQLPVE